MIAKNYLFLIKRGGKKSFDEAVKYCDGFGMHLPVPTGSAYVKALDELDHGEIWLGLSDEKDEGNWTNIYTGEPLHWRMLQEIERNLEDSDDERNYWEKGQPNGKTKQNHAILNTHDKCDSMCKWKDEHKDKSRNTICVSKSK